MQPDDELCLCFHITKRKVVNYLRIEKPRTASQLSECYGAGTGCGWCRPFLKRLFELSRKPESTASDDLPAVRDYAAQRAKYVRDGHGTPPPDGP